MRAIFTHKLLFVFFDVYLHLIRIFYIFPGDYIYIRRRPECSVK